MRRVKQFIALVLSISMLFSTDGLSLYASQNEGSTVVAGEGTTETTEMTETVEDTEEVGASEETESLGTTEVTEETETTEVSEETEVAESTEQTIIEENTESTEATEPVVLSDEIEEKPAVEEHWEHPTSGYVELDRESETPAVRYDLMSEDSRVQFYTSALESRYVPQTLPVVRNQGSYGTCWAFSSVALAELDLLQNHAMQTDLSELQLSYFTYHSATDMDPLGGTCNDSNELYSGYNFAQVGGNLLFSSRALVNWVGYVDETSAPYENTYDAIYNGLNPELAYGSNTVHLKNAYYINILENPEIVKALIKEYGGAGISYYADDDDIGFNETNSCYYYGQYDTSNHAVTVVGWDDNFSKENFNAEYRPTNDGAWLIRNSWGVDYSDDDQYNLYGYFWLSYEETSISETAYIFDVTAKGSDDYYDNNYQYDGSIYDSGVGFSGVSSFTAANVFTAGSGADNEILKAVSFATTSANQKYTINVYRSVESSANPESGILVATLEGDCDYSGIYTIELDNPVSLDSGESFSVVVTLTTVISGATAMISREYPMDDFVTCTTNAKPGQSLYKYGSTWYDYGAENNRNFCIKAFTNDAQAVAVTGVVIENGDVELGVGEEAQLSAQIEPSTASNLNVTWKSSDESVVTVDKLGKIKGVSYGEATITVTTEDGAYTDEVKVAVTKKLTSISLNADELDVILHEQATLTVSYNPEDTISDKTVIWESSNPAVVGINSDGVVTAKDYGYSIITATVAGKEAKCTVYVIPQEPEITAVALEDGTVEVSWSEVEECLYYLYRYSSAAGSSELIYFAEENETSYIDESIQSGIRYMYYVIAEYEDSSYYAWNRSLGTTISYQITYELNGGTNALKNPTYFGWNQESFTLEDPTHPTAIFEGWYYDSAYKSKVGTINPYNTLKNITVYAKWRARQEVQVDWLIYSSLQDYTGSVFEPTVVVKNDTYTLVEGQDYEISYTYNTVDGVNTCDITVTGIGEYIGSQTVTITERKATIQNDMVSEIPEMIFNGGALEPNPEVSFNGTTLVKDVDYTLTYANNTDIGTGVVTITGIGHFEGEVTRHFLIRTKSMEMSFVSAIADQEYTGTAIEPNIVLTHNDKVLKENVDYRITFSNNIEVGQATVTIKGRGNYVGTIKVQFQIVGADLYNLENQKALTVLVEDSEATYSTLYKGKAIEPAVTLKLSDGKELVVGKDYVVSYTDNVTPGTATITISGKRNYAGSVTKTFDIRKHDIGDAFVTAGRNLTVLYSPAGQSPVPRIEYNGARLIKDVDFVAVYYQLDVSGQRVGAELDKVTDAGMYELVLKGNGTFTGTLEHAATITVKTRALDGGNVVVENPYARIDGDTITAKYQIMFAGHPLTEGTDYAVTCQISENREYVSYVFTGIGNYSGTLAQNFKLVEADIIIFSEGEYKISAIENQSYTGARICPTVSVVKVDDENVQLREGVDFKVSYKYNLKVGTATVVVTGIGDCVGTMKDTFEIVPSGMARVDIYADFIYNTKVQKPEVWAGTEAGTLVEGVDYTVDCLDANDNPVDSREAGTYKVVVTFKGNYTGVETRTYEIDAYPVEALQVEIPDKKYTGAEILSALEEMTVFLDGKKLTEEEKEDLTIVRGENNTGVSDDAVLVISGSGNFTGEAAFKFNIVEKPISDTDLTIRVGSEEISSNTSGYKAEWTGSAIEPSVEIWNGAEKLTVDEDYSLVYRYNTEIGTARIVLYGKGDYQGSRTLYFEIEGLTFSEENGYEVTVAEGDYIYNGTKYQPKVTVTKDGIVLIKGSDYNVSYADNVNAGTAKVIVSGIGRYSGTILKTFVIAPKTIEDATMVKTSSIARQRYTGERITPDITVEIDGVKLVKGKDYTTTVLNAVDAGIATLVVTGIGNYSGVLAEKQFEIYYTTITYVMNGGVNSANNPAYYSAKDSFTLADPEPRDAYNFAGWYSDAKCTKRVYSVKTGTNGNLTFYAKWTSKQVFGIDVSYYQNRATKNALGRDIDWNAVKQDGIDFTMIRVSYGKSLDESFVDNYNGAKKAGIKVGVYCYNTATTVQAAVEQADFVVAQLKGKSLDYPVCLDMEGSTVGALDKTLKTDIVYAFKNVVENAGYDFILYANLDWLKNAFDSSRLSPLEIWLARWRSFDRGPDYDANGKLRMWQYSDSGTIDGICGPVDLDYCYEDYVKK